MKICSRVILADGKNHGLVLFFDWSGSMQDVLILLNQMCTYKKVGTFDVYAFTNEYPLVNYLDNGCRGKTSSYIRKADFFILENGFMMHFLTKVYLDEAS